MKYEELLNELRCCAPDRPEHYVQHQKILSCGDPICASCIQDTREIRCGRCNKINQSDLNSSFTFINKISTNYIESNLSDYSKIVHSKLETTVAGLKGE
jgi:hypothetical protein